MPTPSGARWRAAVAVGLAAALLLALFASGPTGASAWTPPTVVYVPQTGHHLEGDFLTYWRANGRAPLLGYPISERLVEDGVTVQYFERVRLELHPDAAPDGRVVVSALGREAAEYRPWTRERWAGAVPFLSVSGAWRGRDPFARLAVAAFTVDPDDHRFFPETGHTLRYSFKLCWEANGGAARFGAPLSEEFAELSPIDGKVYTTQYFERARFEYHPETPNNYSVVLTPLGTAAAQRRGLDTGAVARSADVPEYAEALFVPPPTPTATRQPLSTATPAPAPVNVTRRPASIPAGVQWIDVDLAELYLTALEGDTVVYEVAISSGRKGYETPPGTFRIFSKVRLEDMRGPDPDLPEGSYYQPDVPYVMYFAAGGFAIHGVYWHNNFGVRATSHGCVGAPVGGAAWLYNWAPIGTRVYVHY